MSHPMTNSMWVTTYVLFLCQSHQSCLIPWSTGCEWHCFISLPGGLINHVSFHDQQFVSDTTWFLCQAVSSIMSHPMTIEQQVSGTTLFLCQAVSLIMPYQAVSNTALFLCQVVSPIMSLFLCPPWFTWPSHDQQVVSLMKISTKQFQHCLILWPTVSEWHAIFQPPSHFSYYNKQEVSHNAFNCVLSNLYHSMMTNSKCVITTTYWSLYILWHNQQLVSGMMHLMWNTVHEISFWWIESQSCFLAHHYAFTNVWQNVCILHLCHHTALCTSILSHNKQEVSGVTMCPGSM